MSYIRCRNCDLAIKADSVEVMPVVKEKKEQKISHDKIVFTCPACGFLSFSFIFPDEE